ncbi:hypothetical protein LTR86_010393 [Recurvomyces mirabilis]|nr:hypothetical protein LTR86_010393 [Recurvomyces mirabilis]
MDTKADITVSSRDVDEAFYAVEHQREAGEATNIDEQTLLRKTDLQLMPLMFMCYFLQYSDKTLINYAAVMGLLDDVNFPDNGFSHLAIAFYCSFLFFESIQVFCLQRFPIAKWLGANTRSYAPLVVLRVLLGVFESATAPRFVTTQTCRYVANHRTCCVLAHRVWLRPLTASSPDAKFKPWQVLFLLYGLVTVVTGILVLFLLPDNPMASRFSPEEKIAAVERLRENQTGVENKHFKWAQLRETLADPRTWILSMIVMSTNIPNGAVSSFSSIIIENFGYDGSQPLLLNLPGAAVGFAAVFLGTWYAGRYNARGIAIIALVIPTIIGGALMAWLPPSDKAGLLVGNYLTSTVGASLPLMYSWIGANYSGHTKKVTMNAIVLMSFCVGNIIGPETFQAKSAPAYIPPKITIVAVLSFAILLVLLLDHLFILENKMREQAGLVDMPANYEFMDLTDKENKNFRYLL